MKRFAVLLGFCCLSACAAPVYTQARLDKTVATWKHVLRLDDYDIVASFKSSADLPHRWAESDADTDRMVIIMHVLSPADYRLRAPQMTDAEVEADITDSVVHELVHVRIKAMSDAMQVLIVKSALHPAVSEDEEAAPTKAEDPAVAALEQEREMEEAIVVRITGALLASRGVKK